MPGKGSKDFIQGYNCQIAVDENAQVIVSSDVTQQSNDKKQLRPLVEKMEDWYLLKISTSDIEELQKESSIY